MTNLDPPPLRRSYVQYLSSPAKKKKKNDSNNQLNFFFFQKLLSFLCLLIPCSLTNSQENLQISRHTYRFSTDNILNDANLKKNEYNDEYSQSSESKSNEESNELDRPINYIGASLLGRASKTARLGGSKSLSSSLFRQGSSHGGPHSSKGSNGGSSFRIAKALGGRLSLGNFKGSSKSTFSGSKSPISVLSFGGSRGTSFSHKSSGGSQRFNRGLFQQGKSLGGIIGSSGISSFRSGSQTTNKKADFGQLSTLRTKGDRVGSSFNQESSFKRVKSSVKSSSPGRLKESLSLGQGAPLRRFKSATGGSLFSESKTSDGRSSLKGSVAGSLFKRPTSSTRSLSSVGFKGSNGVSFSGLGTNRKSSFGKSKGSSRGSSFNQGSSFKRSTGLSNNSFGKKNIIKIQIS